MSDGIQLLRLHAALGKGSNLRENRRTDKEAFLHRLAGAFPSHFDKAQSPLISLSPGKVHPFLCELAPAMDRVFVRFIFHHFYAFSFVALLVAVFADGV